MSQQSCSLFSLFAAYWTEYEAVSLATKTADHAEDEAARDDAQDTRQALATYRLNEVALHICAFVPRIRLEAYLKTRFLETFAAENSGVLEADAVTALLSSLPNLIDANAARDDCAISTGHSRS